MFRLLVSDYSGNLLIMMHAGEENPNGRRFFREGDDQSFTKRLL